MKRRSPSPPPPTIPASSSPDPADAEQPWSARFVDVNVWELVIRTRCINIYQHRTTLRPAALVRLLNPTNNMIVAYYQFSYRLAEKDSMNMQITCDGNAIDMLRSVIEIAATQYDTMTPLNVREEHLEVHAKFRDTLLRDLSGKIADDDDAATDTTVPIHEEKKKEEETPVPTPPAVVDIPEDASDEDAGLCCVCFSAPANTLVLPCMCCVVCRVCSAALALNLNTALVCMRCQRPITAVLQDE